MPSEVSFTSYKAMICDMPVRYRPLGFGRVTTSNWTAIAPQLSHILYLPMAQYERTHLVDFSQT